MSSTRNILNTTDALINAVDMCDLENISTLLAKGVDINGSLSSGDTALHNACRSRGPIDHSPYLKVIAYLLEKGANINAKNIFGRTPLHVAAMAGYSDVVELLLSKGAQDNITDTEFSMTPIQFACSFGHFKTAQTFLSSLHTNLPSLSQNKETAQTTCAEKNNTTTGLKKL
jgi:ankyrin repeat protein